MEFYKEKNFQFKIADLIVEEQFTLWQGWQQVLSPEESVAQFGVVLHFPVREGQLPGKDGILRDVQSQIKYMKKTEFEAQYPKLGKNTRYVRNILVNGLPYRYGFGKTANTALNSMLTMTPGQVPQNTFQQTFNKSLPAANMYSIIAVPPGQEVSQPVQQTQQPVQPIQAPPQINVSAQVANTQPQLIPVAPKPLPSMLLTDGEKTILTSVKNLGTKMDIVKFTAVFVKNLAKPEFGGITADKAEVRAKMIFDTQY